MTVNDFFGLSEFDARSSDGVMSLNGSLVFCALSHGFVARFLHIFPPLTSGARTPKDNTI